MSSPTSTRHPLRIEVEPTMLSAKPPLTHYLFCWEIWPSGRRWRRRRTVHTVTGRTAAEADQALLAFMERSDVVLLED